MNDFDEIVKKKLTDPQIQNEKDYWNELREITQNIILSGLRKTDFFDNAVFMGGTALRLIYGLNRYSEDLDFNFINNSPDFSWEKYYNDIKKHGEIFGYNFTFKNESYDNRKTKSVLIRDESLGIKIKEMNIVNVDFTKKMAGNYRKIKISLDGSYQAGNFVFEEKNMGFPDKYNLKVFDLKSLYGGKLHAILTRKDKHGNDVDEGRDWFDLGWFIKQNINPNYDYLFDKLQAHQNFREKGVIRTNDWLKEQLLKRAEKLNFEKLNDDIFQITTNNNYIELDLEKVKGFIEKAGI